MFWNRDNFLFISLIHLGSMLRFNMNVRNLTLKYTEDGYFVFWYWINISELWTIFHALFNIIVMIIGFMQLHREQKEERLPLNFDIIILISLMGVHWHTTFVKGGRQKNRFWGSFWKWSQINNQCGIYVFMIHENSLIELLTFTEYFPYASHHS
jgi:hypothetical protein